MKFRSVAEICPDLTVLPETDDMQGWNSEHALFAQLINQVRPKTIIEVGSYKGRSAVHMAGLTTDLGTKLYCCDTWLGEVNLQPGDRENEIKLPCHYGGVALYFQFLRNISTAGFADRVYPVLQNSVNAARLLHYLQVRGDLVYIDADHTYEQVYMDLEFYANLVAPGGVMFGDDYNDFPGVKMAVDRFAFERQLSVEVNGPAWVLQTKQRRMK